MRDCTEIIDQYQRRKPRGIGSSRNRDFPRQIGIHQTVAVQVASDGDDGIPVGPSSRIARYPTQISIQDMRKAGMFPTAIDHHIPYRVAILGPSQPRIRPSDVGDKAGPEVASHSIHR